jgi:hypothetical protein
MVKSSVPDSQNLMIFIRTPFGPDRTGPELPSDLRTGLPTVTARTGAERAGAVVRDVDNSRPGTQQRTH